MEPRVRSGGSDPKVQTHGTPWIWMPRNPCSIYLGKEESRKSQTRFYKREGFGYNEPWELPRAASGPAGQRAGEEAHPRTSGLGWGSLERFRQSV